MQGATGAMAGATGLSPLHGRPRGDTFKALMFAEEEPEQDSAAVEVFEDAFVRYG